MTDFIASDPSTLTEATVLAGRDHVVAQMRWMRQYGLQLIESVPHELWYKIAPGTSTHLAWQVGHMAVAQYGLMLFRQRGRVESDMELMPGWLRKNFGRGSQRRWMSKTEEPDAGFAVGAFGIDTCGISGHGAGTDLRGLDGDDRHAVRRISEQVWCVVVLSDA